MENTLLFYKSLRKTCEILKKDFGSESSFFFEENSSLVMLKMKKL